MNEAMNKAEIVTFAVIWLLCMAFVVFRRHKKSVVICERTESSRAPLLAGEVKGSRIRTILVLMGIICLAMNVVFRFIEMSEMRDRNRRFRGQVGFYETKRFVDDGRLWIKAQLYNGKDHSLSVPMLHTDGDNFAHFGFPDLCMGKIMANERECTAIGERIRPGTYMCVNMSMPTNILPCLCILNYDIGTVKTNVTMRIAL